MESEGMKLTPFAKLFFTVVILGVLGYTAWHYKGAQLRKWATGQDKATSTTTSEVSSSDFENLKNAPADPGRNSGSERRYTGHPRRRKTRSSARRGDQHVGRSRTGNRLQQRPRRQCQLRLSHQVRAGREVRADRRPGRETGRVPQRRRRHHVEHGRQLGPRGFRARREQPAAPSRSSCRTGRAAATASFRSPRSSRSKTSRAARSPARSSRRRTSCSFTSWRSRGLSPQDRAAVEKSIIFTQDAPAAAAMFKAQSGRRRRDLGAGSLRRRRGARR